MIFKPAEEVRRPCGPAAFFRKWAPYVLAGCLAASPLAGVLNAAAVNHQPSAADIHRLVSNMAWNERQATEHPAHYYRYLERTVESNGVWTREEIDSPEGSAGLLIEYNGKPPGARKRRANNKTLSKLVRDPRFRQAQLRDQRQDLARRDNVIQNLPDAFIYTFIEKTAEGLIHLKFRPDPKFEPSSRQATVLEGMAGELWVDAADQRLAKVDGKLISDVTVGWGLLAHLRQGGRFVVEQTKGPDGDWHQSALAVDFDGTILVLKGLHVHEKIIRCCFEQVPENLSMEQAVEILRTNRPLPENWKASLDASQNSIKHY